MSLASATGSDRLIAGVESLSKRDSRTGLILAAVLAAILGAPAYAQPLSRSVYDAGISASSGTFILNGQVPYRDFWLLYGPLAGYISAAVIWLTGQNLTAFLTVGYVVLILTAVVGQRLICHRVGVLPSAAIAACAAALPLVDFGLGLSSWSVSMLFGLAAIWVASRGGRYSDLLAGLLLGLAVLARLDLGAYAAIAMLIAFRRVRPILMSVVVLLPLALVLLSIVPWSALFEQLVWYPVVGQRAFRSLPAPSLWAEGLATSPRSWLLYWGPVLVILGAIATRLRGRRFEPGETALLALAILCRLQTLSRADDWHSAQAAVPALLLLAFIFAGKHRAPTRLALGVGAGLLISLAGMSALWLGAPPDEYGRALRAASSLVMAHTKPGEPIFVGELTNRYTLLNPLMGYYLADRPAGVRDTMYNPGVTTTQATQQRMVDDLVANNVRFLLLDRQWAGCYEPSNDSRIPGVSVLDAAIARDYREVADFGALVVLARRDVDLPPIDTTGQFVAPNPARGGIVTCPDMVP